MPLKIQRHGDKKSFVIEDTYEIFSIMTSYDIPVEAFLDTETGECISFYEIDEDGIVFSDEEIETKEEDLEENQLREKIYNDKKRYLNIPLIEQWEPYKFMELFIERVDNLYLREKLSKAIKGKGAFRRFKDLLYEFPDWQAQWYVFEESMQFQQVKEWLEEEGFEVQYLE